MDNKYTYKTDNQLIMLVLQELLRKLSRAPWCNKIESMQLLQELYKRGDEQQAHIPYHVRIKKENE